MKIEPMPLTAVEELLSWAGAEGWNPGLDDAAAFFSTDPNGFLMAMDGDKPAAGISVVKYDNHQGFLGLYICQPDYRGQGIGFKVWEAGLQYLNGYTIGLDGVVAQQDNYKKSGFEFAYRNVRYCGSVDSLLKQAEQAATAGVESTESRPIEPSDLPAILKMDKLVHGFDRRALLEHWLVDTKNRTSIVGVEKGKIVGFGTIRRCLQGSKIGPLIADNVNVAKGLLAQLVISAKADEISLDVPEPNESAISLATEIDLTPVFETARMYRGEAPAYKLDKLFGVTTFELG